MGFINLLATPRCVKPVFAHLVGINRKFASPVSFKRIKERTLLRLNFKYTLIDTQSVWIMYALLSLQT